MSEVFRAVVMRTENDIERLAATVKSVLRLEEVARVSMVQLLERLEEWLEDYIFTVLEDEDMPGMDGYTGNTQYEICLSNTTYVALTSGDPCARHTAAHEFGHLMMHSKQATAFARRSSYDRHVDPEWQADYFADVFLMPAKGVASCASAEEVASRYSVPFDRAQLRFDAVTKIQGELFG